MDEKRWTVLVDDEPVTYEKLVKLLGQSPVQADVVEGVPESFAAVVVDSLRGSDIAYELREA